MEHRSNLGLQTRFDPLMHPIPWIPAPNYAVFWCLQENFEKSFLKHSLVAPYRIYYSHYRCSGWTLCVPHCLLF